MNNLHNRFRTLDSLEAPDLWHEAEARARTLQQHGPRPLSWALIATMLLLALSITAAALIGSGVIKLPLLVEVSASPQQTAPERSGTPTPEPQLGGGQILAYEAYDASNPGPLDVFTVDAATGQQTLLGTLPEGFADWQHRYDLQWGADRKHVLVMDYNQQGPKQLDSPTDAARQLTFVCCEPPPEVVPTTKGDGTSSSRPAGYNWVLSPQSDRIAGLHDGLIDASVCTLCSAPDAIVILDLASGDLRSYPLPEGSQGSAPISWSPDGSTVVVSGCRPCNNADILPEGHAGAPGSGPGPDLATMTPYPAPAHAHLFVVPLDGSPVLELLDEGETWFWSPAWSPDGTTVGFEMYECPPGEHAPYCQPTSSLASMTVANGLETVLGNLPITTPMWSPDGQRIAFEGADGIYLMQADGSQLIRLTAGLGPSWSPDGQWLLYSIHDQALDATTGPWLIAADGGEPRLLGTYGGWAW